MLHPSPRHHRKIDEEEKRKSLLLNKVLSAGVEVSVSELFKASNRGAF